MTQQLLGAIKDKKNYRNDIAKIYRVAIRKELFIKKSTNWRKVNEAIIKRWSYSGLQYIKERAWRSNA